MTTADFGIGRDRLDIDALIEAADTGVYVYPPDRRRGNCISPAAIAAALPTGSRAPSALS
ncbi:MAG: hypothetical protein R6V61_03925 [Wenzhouxiangellaceae bacterium]